MYSRPRPPFGRQRILDKHGRTKRAKGSVDTLNDWTRLVPATLRGEPKVEASRGSALRTVLFAVLVVTIAVLLVTKG